MSAQALERLIAGLYSDAALRRRFRAAPLETAREMGLSAREATAVAASDPDEIDFAGACYDEVRAILGKLERPARRRKR